MITEKIGPYLHLAETKKHLCQIDNKIKHQGYSPNKVDCINALKALEDLENMLKKEELKLDDRIKQKIYSGIEFE